VIPERILRRRRGIQTGGSGSRFDWRPDKTSQVGAYGTRPIDDKLTVWTGVFAALSTGTAGSLAGNCVSEAHACRLPRCSSTSPGLHHRRVFGVVPVGQSRAGASSSCLCQEFPWAALGGCVKILFDANTPAPLARFLRGHEVMRADELGWQGLENGALLDAAEPARLDLLLSCDQNVQYQQNFTSRKLSLLILSSNHWPTLRRIAARIATAVDFVQSGQVVMVYVAIL